VVGNQHPPLRAIVFIDENQAIIRFDLTSAWV
jgi:hypothetical protein